MKTIIVKAHRQVEVYLNLEEIFGQKMAIKLIMADIYILLKGQERKPMRREENKIKTELRWTNCPVYNCCLDYPINFAKYLGATDLFLCLACPFFSCFREWYFKRMDLATLADQVKTQLKMINEMIRFKIPSEIHLLAASELYLLQKCAEGGYSVFYYHDGYDNAAAKQASHFLPPGEMLTAADYDLSNPDHWTEMFHLNLPLNSESKSISRIDEVISEEDIVDETAIKPSVNEQKNNPKRATAPPADLQKKRQPTAIRVVTDKGKSTGIFLNTATTKARNKEHEKRTKRTLAVFNPYFGKPRPRVKAPARALPPGPQFRVQIDGQTHPLKAGSDAEAISRVLNWARNTTSHYRLFKFISGQSEEIPLRQSPGQEVT